MVCSLAQHCSTIRTNLRGPNLAFVLASGDAPLVHKHGIAVFQGGHRVKENRTEIGVHCLNFFKLVQTLNLFKSVQSMAAFKCVFQV
jgi:hypothetical protein